jgi:hypothetical protein
VARQYLTNFRETEEDFTKALDSDRSRRSRGSPQRERSKSSPREREYFPKIVEKEEASELELNYSTEKTYNSFEDESVLICNYVLIMIFSLLNSYSVQGIRYILPKTLTHVYHIKNSNIDDTSKQQISKNATVISFELQISSIFSGLVSFFTGILIENSYLQRLRLLKITNVFSCAMAFLAFFQRKYIDVFIIILKSSITMQDQIVEIYSAEWFDVKRRVMLLSLFNIIQSCSSFLSPFINDVLTNFNYSLNYLVFGILLSILMLLSIFLKKEKFKIILN